MNGDDFLDILKQRLVARGAGRVSDAVLARRLDISSPSIAQNWRGREITPRQIIDALERCERKARNEVASGAIEPIVEFFFLDHVESPQGAARVLFSPTADGQAAHPYLAGLRDRLNSAHGIYIFYDSRGRAIYAGKASRQSLWTEMNLAFNRRRGEVQSIKRVGHPINRVQFRERQEGRRRIAKETVVMHEIASYMSAYEVPTELIGSLEALIVRAFANDLLNVRMENF